ncbi:MAG: hypothetical protein HY606_01535, partial [Planctomycetes bacterium]|nr:hypothetical protein [Planctomycetota bacterium]
EKIAKRFFELAQWCKEKGLEEQRKAALSWVIVYDNSNKKARSFLKFKKSGDTWISENADKLKTILSGWEKPEVSSGQELTQSSKFEQELGLKTTKRQSQRFQVESTYMDQSQLQTCTKISEHTYSTFHSIFGFDNSVINIPNNTTINIIIVRSQPEHARFVQAYYQNQDQRIVEEVMKVNGCKILYPPMFDVSINPTVQQSILDMIVHNTVEVLFLWATRGPQGGANIPWLFESLSYYFTFNMNNTNLTKCVDWKGTGTLKGRNLDSIAKWPVEIRKMVQMGEDPDINSVLKITNMSQMDLEKTLKAWSIVDFLVTEHNETFKQFLKDIKADNQQSSSLNYGINAIKKAFGWNTEELNKKWKEFVLRTY